MKQTTFYTKFLKEKCINTAGQLVNPLDFSFKRVERKKKNVNPTVIIGLEFGSH